MINMQRRHFQFIADTVKSLTPIMSRADISIIAESFAHDLRKTNNYFNKERFLIACGVMDPPEKKAKARKSKPKPPMCNTPGCSAIKGTCPLCMSIGGTNG